MIKKLFTNIDGSINFKRWYWALFILALITVIFSEAMTTQRFGIAFLIGESISIIGIALLIGGISKIFKTTHYQFICITTIAELVVMVLFLIGGMSGNVNH